MYKNLSDKEIIERWDLEPGDVLLTHQHDGVPFWEYKQKCGFDFLDFDKFKKQLITYLLVKHGLHYYVAKLDKGKYSHAALFDGANIIQSELIGVTDSSMRALIYTHHRVDVYRFQHDPKGNCQQPGFDKTLPANPIIDRARWYLRNNQGKGYDFIQLALLFFILYSRESDWDPWFKAFVRISMTYLLEGLEKMQKSILQQKFTCTEAVFRFFDEAVSQSNPYSLTIDECASPDPLAKPNSIDLEESFSDDDIEKLEKQAAICEPYYVARMDILMSALNLKMNADASIPENIEEFWRALYCKLPYGVTPRHLQESPNLCKVAEIKNIKAGLCCPE